MVSHMSIFEGLDQPDDAGGTTLITGIAVEIDKDSLSDPRDADKVFGLGFLFCFCYRGGSGVVVGIVISVLLKFSHRIGLLLLLGWEIVRLLFVLIVEKEPLI